MHSIPRISVPKVFNSFIVQFIHCIRERATAERRNDHHLTLETAAGTLSHCRYATGSDPLLPLEYAARDFWLFGVGLDRGVDPSSCACSCRVIGQLGRARLGGDAPEGSPLHETPRRAPASTEHNGWTLVTTLKLTLTTSQSPPRSEVSGLGRHCPAPQSLVARPSVSRSRRRVTEANCKLTEHSQSPLALRHSGPSSWVNTSGASSLCSHARRRLLHDWRWRW